MLFEINIQKCPEIVEPLIFDTNDKALKKNCFAFLTFASAEGLTTSLAPHFAKRVNKKKLKHAARNDGSK